MGDPVTTQLVVKAVSMGAQMALTASNRIEGARLDASALKVTAASYGTPLEWFRGCVKLDGRPIIHAEDLHESKHTSKTKGGKYDEYKYDGTFAIAIASHEITAVRRVWLDRKLVYQAAGAGPVAPVLGLFDGPQGAPVKLGSGNFRLYLGTEDQMPDPRIEDFFNDRDGPGTTPAFRGTPYLMFEALPLEKFGNRIPTVDVEAVTDVINAYPYEQHDTANTLNAVDMSQDRLMAYTGSEVWDLATRTRISSSLPGTIWTRGVAESGCYATEGYPFQELVFYSPGGARTVVTNVFDNYCSGCAYVNGTVWVYPYAVSQNIVCFYNGDKVEAVSTNFSPSYYFSDEEGNTIAVGGVFGNNKFGISRGSGLGTLINSSASGVAYGLDNGQGQYFIYQAGYAYLVDKETLALVASAAIGGGTRTSFITAMTGASSVWFGNKEVSTVDLTVLRTVNYTDWLVEDVNQQLYDPINNALICKPQYLSHFTWRYLDRINGAGVTLGSIVSAICSDCGVEDADTGALDQLVAGFKTAPVAGKDAVGRLLEIYDSDVRPHEFGLQFFKRGATAASTIDIAYFARGEGDKRYVATETPDKALPRRQTVSFADITKDHQTNTIVSQRPLASTDARGTVPLDLGDLVATPDEAQPLSDRRLRRVWVDRFGVEHALSWIHGAIEPGDAHFLNLDGVVRSVRLERQTFSDDRLRCSWKFDFPGATTLSNRVGPPMDNRSEQEVYVTGPTKAWVMDIPYLGDGEAQLSPLLHFGAGDYGTGYPWPGAEFYEADLDHNEYMAWKRVDATQKAVWGYCSGVLTDADPWCWDRASVLNIAAFGELTSCSEADIYADPTLNQAVIGAPGRWEIVNFATAALQGDGTYNVSTFLRGRRGTEGSVGSHATGDLFVLASSLLSDAIALDMVGQELDFKANTAGRSISGSEVMAIAPFSAATLKPYAPARLKWVFNGTDLVGTITRRTRIGGRWVGGTTIPLGENSEAYEVDLYNGATLKRTITLSGTNSFTYTAAMAAADGITLPTAPTAHVYQMSDAVGRGFALVA